MAEINTNTIIQGTGVVNLIEATNLSDFANKVVANTNNGLIPVSLIVESFGDQGRIWQFWAKPQSV